MDSKVHEKRVVSWLLIFLMVGIVLSPLSAHAADSDEDGVEDSLDDCPWAYGTSPQTVMVVLTKTAMVRPISTMDGRLEIQTSKMNSQQPPVANTLVLISRPMAK